MNKIKFNTTEFEIESYNKTTNFSPEGISSNAYCSIYTNDINAVNALAENTISTIQIYSDQNLIYNLQDANAKIDSINEYLTGNRMGININLTFSNI